MSTLDYYQRYMEGKVCIECTSPITPGQPCAHCRAEHETALTAGIVSDDPRSPSYLPPALQDMPENAGRHMAPALD